MGDVYLLINFITFLENLASYRRFFKQPDMKGLDEAKMASPRRRKRWYNTVDEARHGKRSESFLFQPSNKLSFNSLMILILFWYSIQFAFQILYWNKSYSVIISIFSYLKFWSKIQKKWELRRNIFKKSTLVGYQLYRLKINLLLIYTVIQILIIFLYLI